jgi:WD40 repeat protein
MAAAPVRLAFCLALVAAAAGAEPARTDPHGDPLPAGALARLGTLRFRTLGHTHTAALSPDGALIAVAGDQDSIALLEAASGKEVRRLTADAIGVQNLMFSPDGRTLAAVSHIGLTLYDVATGAREPLQDIQSVHTPVVAFSGDGKRLALGSGGIRGQTIAMVWDLATRKRIAAVVPLQDRAALVALSADGRLLATWGQHEGLDAIRAGGLRSREPARTIQLWEADSGKELRRIVVDGFGVTVATFSPSGKHLAVVEQGLDVVEQGQALGVYAVKTGNLVRRWAVRASTAGLLRYSPDGKLLVAGAQDGAVQVWETATSRRIGLTEAPEVVPTSVAFLPGGKVLVLGVRDQALFLWEVPAGPERSPQTGHTAAVTGLAFLPDGRGLVSCGADGLRWWDLATARQQRHLAVRDEQEPFPGVPGALLSPDGRFFASASHQHSSKLVRVMALASGKELFCVGAYGRFFQGMPVAFAPDGTAVAALQARLERGDAWAGAVCVLDLATGLEKAVLKTKVGERNHLALSPGGHKVALCTGRSNDVAGRPCEICVWDIQTGKETCRLTGQPWSNTLAFSPDGSLLAVAGHNRPVRIVDTGTGQEWPPLEPAGPWSTLALAFSPDGRALAASGHNGRSEQEAALVWELASGKLRCRCSGHRSGVGTLAFAPDGLTLATGGQDTTILLWDVSGRSGTAVGKPSPEDLEGLWSDLGSADARQAHRALARLAAAPADAVALVRRHLPPAAGRPPARHEMEAWVRDLDADPFDVRDKASRALVEAGLAACPVLEEALAAKPPPEMKRRLTDLLAALRRPDPPPERVQPTRALELLERLRTPEARRLLEDLAGGNPNAPLTADARATLRRLGERR